MAAPPSPTPLLTDVRIHLGHPTPLNDNSAECRCLKCIGIIGCLALVIYLVFLGIRLAQRYGH